MSESMNELMKDNGNGMTTVCLITLIGSQVTSSQWFIANGLIPILLYQ
jgi:hypothetical protein